MQNNWAHQAVLATCTELDLKKTFECGQCFRWEANARGIYTGVSGSRGLSVWAENGLVLCTAQADEMRFWRAYFDLETDYAEKSLPFSSPPYLRACAQFGAGIRILRQDPWETLVSFIISQCNNIPRIKKIISALCRQYGEKLESGLYAFPGAETLAPLSVDDLAPLRCGYRAAYILDAARHVCEGRLNFEALSAMPAEQARSRVKSIQGVGDKVANCFLLYGLHRMDSFPIDVWIRRALSAHFPADFDPKVLGSYAGLAQQYIFYYAREHGEAPLEACS